MTMKLTWEQGRLGKMPAKVATSEVGDFSLYVRGKDYCHPILLTREQHEVLQALVHTLPGHQLVTLENTKVTCTAVG